MHELLPEAAGGPLHIHYGVEEMFFVLAGTPDRTHGGGKKWRTIDLYEDDKVNESSLKVLVRAGVNFNKAKAKPAAKKKTAK